MKILIDDLINEDQTQSEHSVFVDNIEYKGWQVAKPLNYEKEYSTFHERAKMAKLVMEGKAIAVQYFSDLTEEEQSNYMKNKIN